jgi:hypothetical protein
VGALVNRRIWSSPATASPWSGSPGSPPRFVAEPRIAQPFERAPGWEARTPPGTLVLRHQEENHYAA